MSYDIIENPINITFSDLKGFKPKLFFVEKKIINVANQIINGRLVVHPKCETVRFNIDSFNWNEIHSGSFMMYLQALNPINILTVAYVLSKKEQYLDTAWDFFNSWTEFYKNRDSDENPLVFHDHGVALRVENLIYFGKICEKNCLLSDEKKNKIADCLRTSGIWLSDESNYTFSHNHGIMQDEALLHLGYLFDNNTWKETAVKRLFDQKKEAFTSEYVHTENSPWYAILVRNLFINIGNFLIENGDISGNSLIEGMEESIEFINWSIQPNGIIAQIGDTQNAKKKSNMADKAPYSCTTHRIYPESGYYFYRSKYSEGIASEMDTWKMVKSGYVKNAHKHADDLSFMLYSKGYEIFTDCGMYSYIKDKFRNFLISAKAHNTLIVDNESYEINPELCNRSGILKYDFFDNYDHVRLYNDSYFDVQITRDFCSCGDLTVIYDMIRSDNVHAYSQLFHTAEDIKIIRSDKDRVVLKIADTNYYVIVQQYNPIDSTDIINGNINKGDYGIISRTAFKLDTINTIKFNKKISSYQYITSIAVVDENGSLNLGDKTVKYDDIKFIDGNFIIDDDITVARLNLPESDEEADRDYGEFPLKFIVRSFDYSIKGNEIILEPVLRRETDDAFYFSFYLMQEDKRIKKTGWQKESKIKFTVDEPGIYWIKCFIKNDTDKKSFPSPQIVIDGKRYKNTSRACSH